MDFNLPDYFKNLNISFLNILDIVLVIILIYQVWKWLRNSLAFNIFIGLVFVYLITVAARWLDMRLISGILGQFINVGVLLLVIVFQPEIRRFLLYLGRGQKIRNNKWFQKYFMNDEQINSDVDLEVFDIVEAIKVLSNERTGALVVFTATSNLQHYADNGTIINGEISKNLILSIFDKTSPLHDGAIIIDNDKIKAASSILPTSDNPDLPRHLGTRHRAAVGITEMSDATAIVVSEESGKISIAKDGGIHENVSITELQNEVTSVLKGNF